MAVDIWPLPVGSCEQPLTGGSLALQVVIPNLQPRVCKCHLALARCQLQSALASCAVTFRNSRVSSGKCKIIVRWPGEASCVWARWLWRLSRSQTVEIANSWSVGVGDGGGASINGGWGLETSDAGGSGAGEPRSVSRPQGNECRTYR